MDLRNKVVLMALTKLRYTRTILETTKKLLKRLLTLSRSLVLISLS